MPSTGNGPVTKSFELDDLSRLRRASGQRWHEFLRVPALSAGLYGLPAGGEDPQPVHSEDELYHVLRGRAILRVAGEDHPVGPGSLIYVAAGVDHRFHSIEEDLEVLVVFAPAESAQR